jgi:hypothetical protein
MQAKFKTVLLPYLAMSCFAIPLALLTREPFPWFYFGTVDTIHDQVIRPAVLYLVTGGVFAYWYIPFILCIFALSPLFILFIRCRRSWQLCITVVLLFVALVLHRPVDNILVPQSVLFFSPVYLFGILCSLEKALLYEKLADKTGILLILVILLAVLQAVTSDFCGNLQKPPFIYNGIDISLIQKLILCVLLMVYLHRFEEVRVIILPNLASASFAVYFLHGWPIYLFSLIQDRYVPLQGVLLLPFTTLAVISLSYLSAVLIRKRFPKRSRQLIGW